MWFTENPWPPILIVMVVALVFLVLWNANRRGVYMVLAVGCALACLGIYALERAIVTEGEKLEQHVVQFCNDFRAKKPGTLDYVSDTKPKWKDIISEAMALVTIKSDLRLSDFQTSVSNNASRGTVKFRASAAISVEGTGDVGYHPVQVEFILQRENGAWKIIDIKRFNPFNGKEMDPLQRSDG